MPVPIWLTLCSALLTFGLAVLFTKPHEHEEAGLLLLPSTAGTWFISLIFTGVLSTITALLIAVLIFAIAPQWLEFAAVLACKNGVGAQVQPGASGIILLPEFQCAEAGRARDITLQTIAVGAQSFFFGCVLPIFYFTSRHVELNQ